MYVNVIKMAKLALMTYSQPTATPQVIPLMSEELHNHIDTKDFDIHVYDPFNFQPIGAPASMITPIFCVQLILNGFDKMFDYQTGFRTHQSVKKPIC